MTLLKKADVKGADFTEYHKKQVAQNAVMDMAPCGQHRQCGYVCMMHKDR